MGENKLDITSTAVEKAIDSVRSFLGMLVGPTVEELGLLMKEKAAIWRFNNQVKMLQKAIDVCNRNGISPKAISLKLLTPLLANAELEEDEYLQDKWAILLSNLVDPQQNVENNIFPYILSQISRKEFEVLEKEYDRMILELNENRLKLVEYLKNRGEDYQTKMTRGKIYDPIEAELNDKIDGASVVATEHLEPYEFANLVRCGVLKTIQVQSGHAVTGGSPVVRRTNVEIQYLYDEFVFTELGVMFLRMCKEKGNRI